MFAAKACAKTHTLVAAIQTCKPIRQRKIGPAHPNGLPFDLFCTAIIAYPPYNCKCFSLKDTQENKTSRPHNLGGWFR